MTDAATFFSRAVCAWAFASCLAACSPSPETAAAGPTPAAQSQNRGSKIDFSKYGYPPRKSVDLTQYADLIELHNEWTGEAFTKAQADAKFRVLMAANEPWLRTQYPRVREAYSNCLKDSIPTRIVNAASAWDDHTNGIPSRCIALIKKDYCYLDETCHQRMQQQRVYELQAQAACDADPACAVSDRLDEISSEVSELRGSVEEVTESSEED